ASPSASTSVAPTCPTTTFGDDSISTSWPLKILTSMLPPDEMADELRQSGARWIGLDICRVIGRRRPGRGGGMAIARRRRWPSVRPARIAAERVPARSPYAEVKSCLREPLFVGERSGPPGAG